MLLALDTSTQDAGVALYGAGGLLAEANWRAGRKHSEQLLTMVQLLCANLGVDVRDLRGVAVALGPGSWSGVRVGISTAKGIALAAGIPLLGVDGLEILAYPHQRTGRVVVPVIRLGRERYAITEYRLRRQWGPISEPRNVSRQELLDSLPELALVCGDIDAALAAAITRTHDAGVVVASPAVGVRRAGYLAELAWLRLQAGEQDDPVTLEPIYLGTPVRSKPA